MKDLIDQLLQSRIFFFVFGFLLQVSIEAAATRLLLLLLFLLQRRSLLSRLAPTEMGARHAHCNTIEKDKIKIKI